MQRRPVLDPVVERWLRRIDELGSTVPASPPAERDAALRLSDLLFDEFGCWDVGGTHRIAHVVETSGGTLRLDEYRPADTDSEVLPAYLTLHGGSFRLGTLDERVNVVLCSSRARDARYAVYSLDYRLAPGHPYPAAVDDATHALSWLLQNAAGLRIDPDRLVTGGVSAGGGIAAALALRARDRGLPVRGQLLEVPVVDARDDGIWLDQYSAINGFTTMADLRGAYSNPSEAHEPGVSPILGALGGLPPTHIMVAEYDPLRAAAEEFARRLHSAGNVVTATRHLGHLHGTQNLTRDFRGARLWHAEAVAVLREFAQTATPNGDASATPAG